MTSPVSFERKTLADLFFCLRLNQLNRGAKLKRIGNIRKLLLTSTCTRSNDCPSIEHPAQDSLVNAYGFDF